MHTYERAFFVAAVEHDDGYNGHKVTAYVCFDHEIKGCIAVYPHGWHQCPHAIAMQACDIRAKAEG